MIKRKNYKILEVNILFLLLGIIFLTFGAYVQSKNFESGILITEYIIVLMPVIAYGFFRKIDLINSLRIKKIKFKVLIKVIFLGLFLVPIIGFGNLLVTTILKYYDLVIEFEIPSAYSFTEFIKYFFLIGISAGLCEEIFFRGMILNAYESHTNRKFALIMSSLLFGIFHFNIQNLLGPMLLGAIFSYLVFVTDSIFPAIIAHTLNNGVSVLAAYLININSDKISEVSQTTMDTSFSQILMGTIFFGILASISLFIISLFIKSIAKDCFELEENESILIDSNPVFIVKKKKKGIIIVKENLNFLGVTIKELFSNLKFIRNDELKGKKIKKNLRMNKKFDYKSIIYSFIPIILSIVLYVIFTKAIWEKYNLI